MCGIAGFLGFSGVSDPRTVALDMCCALRHRGPDADGVWLDPGQEIALAHTRLSILDLSDCGSQPMVSYSRRWIVSYNGEIYNHRDIRADLVHAGITFRGHSDTEVLANAIELWGLEQTLVRTNGMLALAAWDRGSDRLFLARDRMGKKPLYYGWSAGVFLFGSELDALAAHPSFHARIDAAACSLYRRYNHVPAPYSIYEGIRKLPPATWLEVDRSGAAPEPRAYWSLSDVIDRGRANQFRGSRDELLDSLDTLLVDSVSARMESDVPLGALLSGGVDSSLVVAIMQEVMPRPVRTYTIGFDEVAFNEAKAAASVASHLGTDHTELYVTPADAQALIPGLADIDDEPFADALQIPTALVCRMARQHVTVALSGDGGDELFGGYERYRWATSIWKRSRMLGRPGRRAAGAPLATAASTLSALRQRDHAAGSAIGPRLRKLGHFVAANTPEDLYFRLVSNWGAPAGPEGEPMTLHRDRSSWPSFEEPLEWMMYLDTLTYLADDILAKVDRAAMAYGLEVRAPLLDYRVVEFAWHLRLSDRVEPNRTKWPLRELLERRVPAALTDRPKMGFGVPIGEWLRGPLRDWAESLLEPDQLAGSAACVDGAVVRKQWQRHLAGDDWTYDLWNVLMLQSWMARTSERRCAQTSPRAGNGQ